MHGLILLACTHNLHAGSGCIGGTTGAGGFSLFGISMASILTGLAGSSACGVQITGLFQLLVYLLSELLNTIFGYLWTAVLFVLNLTLLNRGAGAVVQADVQHSYFALSGIVAVVAVAAFVWRVLQMQVENIGGSRREGIQQLVGRVGTVVLWLAGGTLFVTTLIRVNEAVVGMFSQSMRLAALNACPTAGPAAGVSDALFKGSLMAGGGVFVAFFGEVFVALAVGLLLYVILAWLVRLFEVIFWASVMPVALALSIADPQAKLWTYVKSQLVGAVFVQAAMAFGIWLIVTQVMSNGQIFGNGANSILNTAIALAGLFFVGKLPRYWQEMNGHSTSGGIDAAQLAMGYMGGRLGTQLLSATPAGQLLNASSEAGAAKSAYGLQSGTSFAGRLGGSPLFRRQKTTAAAQAAAAEMGYEQDLAANPAISDRQADVQVAQAKRLADARTRNPLAENLHARPERPLVPPDPEALTGVPNPDAATFAQGLGPYAKSFAATRQRLITDNPAVRGAFPLDQTEGIRATGAMTGSLADYAALQEQLDGAHPEEGVARLFNVSPEDLNRPDVQQRILSEIQAPLTLADLPAHPAAGPVLGHIRRARVPNKLPPNYPLT